MFSNITNRGFGVINISLMCTSYTHGVLDVKVPILFIGIDAIE